MSKKVQIKQIKSRFGCSKKQQETLKSLGLKKPGNVVERELNDSVNGMLFKVKHLVEVKGEK